MELDGLRTFVRAVSLGSLSAAARARGRSQPAVTAQMQALERSVGERLLVRAPRGVRPTPAGALLYARAQGLLREADELLEEVRGGGSLRSGRLRIGATDVMAIALLPRGVRRLRARYPGLGLTVSVAGSRALAGQVLQGELDLALVTLPLEAPGLVAEEVHREPIEFVAAAGHPAAGRRLTLAALAREAIIHHSDESVTRAEVAAVFRRAGLEPRVAMEVSSPEAMKQLVLLGLGIAPFSRSQAAAEIRSGRLVRLRVQGFRCFRRSGIVHRREALQLRAVSAFLALRPGPAGRRAGPRPGSASPA